MNAVVVIEPHALLRFGILRHLTEALPRAHIEGTDYTALSDGSPVDTPGDLVLLSVPFHENVHTLIEATQRVFAPKQILLLSDAQTMPRNWVNLPPVVAGYVSKMASPEMLSASVRLVLLGGKCFQTADHPAEASERTISTLGRSPSSSGDNEIPPSTMTLEAEILRITPRQYEVLVLLARGYPIKTISRQLGISIATAKAHAETLYQRLDAHNRNEAVYAAITRGATLGWQRLNPHVTPPPPTFVSPSIHGS
jgi:DNA-binding NarL/FixJ family response regulator